MSAALEIIEARISSEDQKNIVDLTDEDILGRHESDFGVEYELDTYKLSIVVSFYDNGGPMDSNGAYVLVDDRVMTFVANGNERSFPLPAGGRKQFDIYAAYKKLLAVINDYEKLRAQFKLRKDIKINGLDFKRQPDTDSNVTSYQLTELPPHIEAKIIVTFDSSLGNLDSVRVVIADGSKSDVKFIIRCRESRCDYFNFNQRLAAELRKYKHRIANVLSSLDSPLEIKLDMGALHKHATIDKDAIAIMHDIEKILSNHGITLEVQRHG